MGVTALWTAAHYRIPLLIVVANNRSFYNDEVHQERVARMRNRPVENRWIGQRISDPDIDLAALARAQGALGFGPVEDAGRARRPRSPKAIAAVEQGEVAVVDVRVEPGYTPAMTAAVLERARGKRDAAVTRLERRAAHPPTGRSPCSWSTTSSKHFETPDGVLTAVDHISFDVAPGEFLSVIGPSGCGKSTLFNIIGGLLDGYEGRVTVAGETVHRPASHRSAWCSRRNRPSPGAP